MSTTIDKTVAASADDASEVATVVSLTANPLANMDTSGVWNGWRFTGITIPALAHVTAAYLTVKFTSSTLDEPDITIYGEKQSAPAQFTTGASNISGRARSTATVNWSNSNAGTGDVNTSDLSTIIQELINAYAPYSSGVMAFVATTRAADSSRDTSVTSYDGSTTLCGRLHIVYDAPSEATLTKTQANDTVAATATVEAQAILASTQAANTISATFTAANQEASATLSLTQDADALAATATVDVAAVLSKAQADDVLVATGIVEVRASLAAVQTDDDLASSATAEARASLAISQMDDILASTATMEARAALSILQADDQVTGVITIPALAVLSIEQANETVTATFIVTNSGEPVEMAANLFQGGDTLRAFIGKPLQPKIFAAPLIGIGYGPFDLSVDRKEVRWHR